jgi:transcriptional regulator with XRE-family HTH domain
MSTHARVTLDALRVLGLEISHGRRSKRWTMKELAERAGVSIPTVRKAEQGDPTVAIGTAFELATLVGVPLFNADSMRISEYVIRGTDRLAVLPSRIRPIDRPVFDDF